MDHLLPKITAGIFSLLFYRENVIIQYAVQKTLTDVFGASLLLLRVFMRISKDFV